MAVETKSIFLLPYLHKADGSERNRLFKQINSIPSGVVIGEAFVEAIDYDNLYTGTQPEADFPHPILVANAQNMGIDIRPMSLKLSINPIYGELTLENDYSLWLQVTLGSIDQLAAHRGLVGPKPLLDIFHATNKPLSVSFTTATENLVVEPNSLWLARFTANFMQAALEKSSK